MEKQQLTSGAYSFDFLVDMASQQVPVELNQPSPVPAPQKEVPKENPPSMKRKRSKGRTEKTNVKRVQKKKPVRPDINITPGGTIGEWYQRNVPGHQPDLTKLVPVMIPHRSGVTPVWSEEHGQFLPPGHGPLIPKESFCKDYPENTAKTLLASQTYIKEGDPRPLCGWFQLRVCRYTNEFRRLQTVPETQQTELDKECLIVAREHLKTYRHDLDPISALHYSYAKHSHDTFESDLTDLRNKKKQNVALLACSETFLA